MNNIPSSAGYLFDSNIIVALLKGDSAVIDLINQSSRDKMRIYFSSISVCEIFSGIKDEEQPYIEKIFDNRVLDVTLEISREAGLLRKKLRDDGRKLKTPDALIAATSIVHHLCLVTRDSDFKSLSSFGIKCLKLS